MMSHEREKCEAERAHAREEIVIHVTAAVIGRLAHGVAVVFEGPGGKRFEAALSAPREGRSVCR